MLRWNSVRERVEENNIKETDNRPKLAGQADRNLFLKVDLV